jgi:diadenosine tetraphosphatase ApaH/serine/threonine PP2A family protein phosphatase
LRYLILSDIHGNWEALNGVLQDASGSYDIILNCGDVVGYGPDPNAVVEWCRDHTPNIVRGNHDVACATLSNLEWFNPVAAKSAEWTHSALTPDNLSWLRDIPKGPLMLNGLQLVHGSPGDEDEYLVNTDEIAAAAGQLERPLAFFGHTHIQGCYLVQWAGVKRLNLASVDLDPDATYMVNPGSVGQPRDQNPLAAYALYDSERRFVELRRVTYDVRTTQEKILRLGLPEMLAIRLGLGR